MTTCRKLREEEPSADRRRRRRYSLSLAVRWKLLWRAKPVESGVGRTLDLSSGGVLFETDQELPVGMKVEVYVSWPVLLDTATAIQLVVAGNIVRSEQNQVAVQFTQHEFRTCGPLLLNRGDQHSVLNAFDARRRTRIRRKAPFSAAAG